MFAPPPAASRINFSARAMLVSRSQLHAICVAATVTVLIKYSARKPGPSGREQNAAPCIELTLPPGNSFTHGGKNLDSLARNVVIPFPRSKRRRRARAHELALLVAGVSKPVRNGALEVIGIARGEHPGIRAHGQFDLTLDDDAPLLTRVREHFFAGVGLGRIALVQNRHAAFAQAATDQSQLYRARTQVGEFVAREEYLGLARKIQGEEVRQRHRYAVQDLFEGTHRRTHPVLFNERNQAVGDAGALRQLTLRQPVHLPHRLQMDAHVYAHLFIILNSWAKQPAEIELSVDFPYHWCREARSMVVLCFKV